MIPDKIYGPSIHFEQVSLEQGSQTLLDNISCQFDAGQWHAVLGPNGGGKSTLLKTLLGLTPHQGKVTIQWPGAIQGKGRIGYLPQQIPFDSSLPISVRDYLLMSLSSRPVWFKRKLPKPALEALEHIHLINKLDRKIGDLSGGERQRLMLSTALLQKPSVLILDEPMTGLDKDGQQDALSLLTQFHQAGGTIIMVEHDWALVQKYCQNIFWIDKQMKIKQTSEAFFHSKAVQNIQLAQQLTGIA